MLRYSLLRILVFLGVLSLLWLLGLRDRDEQWMLLVLSALISLVLSYFVLARFREEATQTLAARVEQRTRDRQAAPAQQSDEAGRDPRGDRERPAGRATAHGADGGRQDRQGQQGQQGPRVPLGGDDEHHDDGHEDEQAVE